MINFRNKIIHTMQPCKNPHKPCVCGGFYMDRDLIKTSILPKLNTYYYISQYFSKNSLAIIYKYDMVMNGAIFVKKISFID